MFLVLVRHYLSDEGKEYFKEQWFPIVEDIISQKNGFISIEYSEELPDCMFITIKFQNKETFFLWNTHSLHDDVINKLDSYRSRDYWESTHNEKLGFSDSNLLWDRNNPASL